MIRKLFIFVFFITLLIRLLSVNGRNVAFTSDQARDMIEIRQMVVAHSPKLLGPVTDILGLYLGPFWFYFNLPPFVISGGDPMSLVHWQILWFHLSIFMFWYLTARKNVKLGSITAIILLLMPLGFEANSYSFNANAALIVSVIYFTVTYQKGRKWRLLEGVIAGISLQIEAPLGILFIMVSLLRCLSIDFAVGLLITLFPQFIYEIKSHFSMSKSFLSQLQGGTDYLSSNLNFVDLITDRFNYLKYLINSVIYLPPIPHIQTVVLAMLGYILIVKREILGSFKSLAYLHVPLLCLCMSMVFYFFIFKHIIKSWYLYGLVVPLAIVLGLLINALQSSKKLSILGKVLFVLVVVYGLYTSANNLIIKRQNQSDDPSNLANLQTTIDYVYKEAKGLGFSIYNYVPSVYDSPQQYLYWWYGTKSYGYQPDEVAYLPNQPEYVRFNSRYWQKKRPANGLVYLVVQRDLDRPDRQIAWLGNFNSFCPLLIKEFLYRVDVYKLGTCKLSEKTKSSIN